MALACEPEVLIADEPTTALDVTVQAEILVLLNNLIEQTETTLVFISHDLPVVASVAQGLVVMHEGKIVEETTVTRALTGPNQPYTQHLLDSARKVTAMPEGTVTDRVAVLDRGTTPHESAGSDRPAAATQGDPK